MKIEEILAVKHLSVEFQTSDGKKQVVKDVSLSLRQGEVLALVGESGCGKTVLCRSILKLLPKSASVTGEAIQYKDQNLIGYNEKVMQQIRGQGIADGLSGSTEYVKPDDDSWKSDGRGYFAA